MNTGKTGNCGQTIRDQESREKIQIGKYNPRNLDENTFHESPEEESNVGGFDSEREENHNADNNADHRSKDDETLQHNDYSDIESQNDDFHDN